LLLSGFNIFHADFAVYYNKAAGFEGCGALVQLI
jgi:hypothetical protein